VTDVYLSDLRPLDEGVKKHTIAIFVSDESGLINRVAGVFARRGANIESLAVGLNMDRALFTIQVTGTDSVVENLVRQLGKLVSVRYVEVITDARRIDRELLILKVRAPSGPARTEVLQLAEIFRASVIDVSDRFLTIAATGDPGKVMAFQNAVTKFGIAELARTGKISLKRGMDLLEQGGGGWGESASAGRRQTRRGDVVSKEQAEALDVFGGPSGEDGVWQVENVLDAAYSLPPEVAEKFTAHTLSILLEDVPGILNRVTGVLSRRGYNVQSLAVGTAETPGLSRITVVVPAAGGEIDKLVRQIEKTIGVESVAVLNSEPFVYRELMLLKVRCTAGQRREIKDVCDIFRASIVDTSLGTLTLQITGREEKMRAVQDVLAPYGVLEVARTGRVALRRESGVDSKLLDAKTTYRVQL